MAILETNMINHYILISFCTDCFQTNLFRYPKRTRFVGPSISLFNKIGRGLCPCVCPRILEWGYPNPLGSCLGSNRFPLQLGLVIPCYTQEFTVPDSFTNAAGVYVPGSGVWYLGRPSFAWDCGDLKRTFEWENEDPQSTKIVCL